MCGRYYVDDDNAQINAIISRINDKSELKLGEIFPTNHAAVISKDGTTAMQWGFTGFNGKEQIINARSETIHEKPMFRKAFIENRCLVPASYYFEWRKEGSSKIKYALKPQDTDVSYLAGIARKNKETDEQSFVIITRPAVSDIEFIHDRMPVILPVARHDEWINRSDPQETMGSAKIGRASCRERVLRLV